MLTILFMLAVIVIAIALLPAAAGAFMSILPTLLKIVGVGVVLVGLLLLWPSPQPPTTPPLEPTEAAVQDLMAAARRTGATMTRQEAQELQRQYCDGRIRLRALVDGVWEQRQPSSSECSRVAAK